MLSGKSIVVTGANRGIGKAIVEKCLENHANVWACARYWSEDLKDIFRVLAKENEMEIRFVLLDLSDEESIKEAAKSILSDKIPIDGIVNNAGVTGANRLFSMTTMEEIRQVFDVNFFGPMFFTQRLLKNMMRYKIGSIVNMSSVAAIDGEPAQLEYVSSKSALIGATKKLASELRGFGIRVNAVAPGMTDTEMITNMSEDLRKRTLENTILGRVARPEEIAEMVIFLLSDKSSFLTGQTIRIDGGCTI